MTLHMNPVVGRELKERVRGLKAFVILSVFVLILVLTTFLVYEGTARNVDAFNLAERTLVGRRIFETVTLVMVALVLFFVPGLTAGAVAGERERQTLLPLQVTLMRPYQILAGKVTAALAYLVLLIVAAIPVMAVAYALGGLRVIDIVRAVVAVVALAVVIAAMVISISTFVKRAQTATLLSYAFMLLVSIIGPLLFGVVTLINGRDDPTASAPAALLAANPVVGVADFAAGSTNSDVGPMAAIRSGVYETRFENGNSWWSSTQRVDATLGDDGDAVAVAGPVPANGRMVVAGDDIAIAVGGIPDALPVDGIVPDGGPGGGLRAWMISLLSLGGAAAIMFTLAARRLRAPADEER
jgi:ABC-type transport system involved in multi-copper enzyme maturation permease subunit